MDSIKEKQLAVLIGEEEPKPKRKVGRPLAKLADTFDDAMAACTPIDRAFVRHVLAGDNHTAAYRRLHPAARHAGVRASGVARKVTVAHALALGRKAGALQTITGIKYDLTKAHDELCARIDAAHKEGQHNAVASLMKLKMTLHKLDQPQTQQQQGVQIILQSADGVTVRSFGGVPLAAETIEGEVIE